METGFTQLVTGSPFALPIGTRPEATAPATVPMKNGVSTDEERERAGGQAPASLPFGHPLEGEARAA
jgi:hypothetical protein